MIAAVVVVLMADRGKSGKRTKHVAKSADAFRTISEVSGELDVPQHVLRFWETKFSQIKPLKRGGGRRYYRPEDIDLLRKVRHWLYTEGYTIKGVQKLLRGGAAKVDTAAKPGRRPGEGKSSTAAKSKGALGAADGPQTLDPSRRAEIAALVHELQSIRNGLTEAQ